MERPAGLREAHLCAAWERGLLDPERLITAQGLALQVVYPGRRCGDPGPDFRDAVIALPDATLRRGDIEVHLDHAGWQAHGHASDSAYDRVILHLTWDAAPPVLTRAGHPVLALALSACLSVAPETLPLLPTRRLPLGPTCPAALTDEAPERIAAFLQEQGEQRFLARAARLAADALFAGDDQALWQALLRGLGYHRNTAPFERLARCVPWSVAASVLQDSPTNGDLEALLLGAAGFLAPLDAEAGSRAHRASPSARILGDAEAAADEARRAALAARWQALRGWVQDRPLARADWTFAGVRPDNAPPRRIAAAAALADRHRRGLLAGLAQQVSGSALPFAFDLREDAYWRAHADFGRPVGPNPMSLLGAARERELLANAVLPAVLAVARRDGDEALAEAAITRYRALPGAGGNSITRHMLKTISARPAVPKSAAMEQGLLHLYHQWCRERRCWECAVPLAFPAATIAPHATAEGETK